MNQKWYINEDGVKVKPCSSCGRHLPYTLEYYTTRGSGKWSAYCKECSRVISKKYNKTDKTRKKGLIFNFAGSEYKVCTKCEEMLPHTFEFFDKASLGQGGFRSDCRKCRLAYNRGFSERRWAWQLYNNARQSSNRLGLPMDITEEYILGLYKQQDGRCYWLGLDMIPSSQRKSPLQPSLDRLDRRVGYVQGNVVLCCFTANFGRNDNTEEEWKQFLERMISKLDYSQWQ